MSSPVKLHAPFALAQDTANILGVSSTRLAALRRILADAAKPVGRARASRSRGPASMSVGATAIRSAKKASPRKKNSFSYSGPRKVSAKKK